MNPADTPDPPYFAVIFTSVRTGADPAYDRTADRMIELASRQPGFLGVESARDDDGFGITVSYWESEEAIRRWRREGEHVEAQKAGKTKWYSDYRLRIARVDRAYGRHGEP